MTPEEKAADMRLRRSEWTEERRAYQREWQRRYRAKLGSTVSGLRDNYRLSLEEARAVAEQKGDDCDICDRQARLCYDHDHETGRFRGWLCYRCNHGLHMLEDTELLAAARNYLEAS